MKLSRKPIWILLLVIAMLFAASGADCPFFADDNDSNGDLSDDFEDFIDDIEDAF